MYLVDTNVVIWILRGKESYIKWFEVKSRNFLLSISVITIGEIYQNILPTELAKTDRLLEQFKVRLVTIPIAKQAGLYWQQYIKHVKTLSLPDCLIAATADAHKLKLVTLNTRHFPMSDIQVIKPL